LLSDNGPCYVSGALKEYLKDREIDHTRGAPSHPMTQGKIERYHRTMKNVVKLQNYYLPGELSREIGRFVSDFNNRRYHESLDNVTDVTPLHRTDRKGRLGGKGIWCYGTSSVYQGVEAHHCSGG
jgi:transposase InsO family protein